MINAIDGRIIEKKSMIPGVVPTVAPSFDHTDGSWSATDIYNGEFFVNIPDEKVFMRCGSTIVEISPVTPTAVGLDDVLAVDNTTGANDIEVDNDQFIKYVTQPDTQVGFDDLTVITKKFVDDSIAAYVPVVYGLDEVLLVNNDTGGTDIHLDQNSTISVKTSGAPVNAMGGVVTLVGGLATVNTTAVEADSIIILTHQNNIGFPGSVHVNARTVGTSFDIESTSATDVSDIGWFIIRQH